MKPVIALAFGAVFGFLLSRVRATDYRAIVDMFLLTDLYLAGVIVCAIATAALGLWMLRRNRVSAALGGPVNISAKPYHRGVFAGGLVFGVGWALAGACPGTAFTQVGEGKLFALATVAGILVGTWLYRVAQSSSRSAETAVGNRAQ